MGLYEKGGEDHKEFGPVIFCSGGFGADFTQNSLLAMYRPDLLHLPTTNGEHCTGDAIKMGEAIGAKTIDLEWVASCWMPWASALPTSWVAVITSLVRCGRTS